jgi:murein DD-endopeptidase MepM/ murein hydrolase activator NlpD
MGRDSGRGSGGAILILLILLLGVGGLIWWNSQHPTTPASSTPAASSSIPPESGSGAPPASSSAAPPSSEAPASSSAEPPASSSVPPSSAAPAPASDFTFAPPGHLEKSGVGVTDGHIWIAGMRFPIQAAKAFANSQVNGHGGMGGPGGGQCDSANYVYPWHDNFCETRGYTTVLCPTGKGHQGQDIRPNSCKAATYTAVAAEPGTITQISSYIVYLTADSGRRYDYLHLQMNQLKVHVGQHVARGQALGLVSNNFGSTPTTIHLHLEIKQAVTHNGTSVVTFIPLYSSLVDAYQRMLAGTP